MTATIHPLPAPQPPDTPDPDQAAFAAAFFSYAEPLGIAAEDRVAAQLAVTSLDAGLTAILGLPR
jgi:hypothetical protein